MLLIAAPHDFEPIACEPSTEILQILPVIAEIPKDRVEMCSASPLKFPALDAFS
jgi:hypothetical protein